MGRPHRLCIRGGIYHVMNRGNRKAVIFEDKYDRRQFLEFLDEAVDVNSVKLLSGCLIDNHFHLDVHTPHGNLPDFMQHFQSRFARRSNARYRRVGHMFQGRYPAVLIEHDLHLFTTLAYIFMNPVRAGIATSPERCQWSTYAATIGCAPRPNYLSLDWLPVLFPGSDLRVSQRELREVMADPKPLVAYLQRAEQDVSPDRITTRMRSYVGDCRREAEQSARPTLTELLQTYQGDRAGFICDARRKYGYRVSDIARELQMSANAVSDAFWRAYRNGSK